VVTDAPADLKPVQVSVSGVISGREWYVVADLGEVPRAIIKMTVEFTIACAKARGTVGGSASAPEPAPAYSLGLDEKGRITRIEHPERSSEVVALQGYVWEALKKHTEARLTKPTRNGFTVDGVITPPGLLLEIKTSVAAHFIYEAVGQLKLYSTLIGLDHSLSPVLLLPVAPLLKPIMAAALDEARIEVYTYSFRSLGPEPEVVFSAKFLRRCGL
jgi:hypothetical protein